MLKSIRIKKSVIAIMVILIVTSIFSSCSVSGREQKILVKMLLLPKFETGDLSGDFPGEAQYFYEEYLAGGEVYEIGSDSDKIKLYYKDGIAMCLLGQGKVSSALSTSAVLSDPRFDYSDAYILSLGCGGASEGYAIPGDVFVISGVADYDLGNWADAREIKNSNGTTWFHEKSFDDTASVRLNKNLTDRVFELVKDVEVRTTEKTEKYMQKEFPGQAWADRDPKVMRGSSLTGDHYWKGSYGHQNALLIAKTYNLEDPYAITEMEDIAVALTAKHYGLLDRLIILRVAVNMDVFPEGVSPETIWDPGADDHIASEESMESVDVFETGMKNLFDVGKVVIESGIKGTL